MSKLSAASLPGLILVIIGAFLVLNYFNVISLSLLYPKYFGSLPHVPLYELGKKNPVAFLLCPTIADPCGAERIEFNGKYVAMGFKIPPGMEFRSVFQGTGVFSPEKAPAASHVRVTGRGEALGYEANYDYFPASSAAKFQVRDVFLGESLDKVGTQTFDGKGTNLMFRLLDKNGKNIELKPTDFRH